MHADAFILLVGESGSGKTTVADVLEECYDLKQLRSYTTRPKRFPTENNHTFVSQEQFNNLTGLVAYTKFAGYEYCATEDQVQNSNVYVIDPAGIEYFKAHYTGNKSPIVIYLSVPLEERFNRMITRGDSKEAASIRIKHDVSAFKDVELFADYIVEGITVCQVVQEILEIIRSNDI